MLKLLNVGPLSDTRAALRGPHPGSRRPGLGIAAHAIFTLLDGESRHNIVKRLSSDWKLTNYHVIEMRSAGWEAQAREKQGGSGEKQSFGATSWVEISAQPFLTLWCCSLNPAAAAAKSLQSCLTLCNPIDGSPPASPVPGILQERTLEWVAISFSSAGKWKVKGKSFSRVRLWATPWIAAYQAPSSMGFSRQEYWSGVPSHSLTQSYWAFISSSEKYREFLLVKFASGLNMKKVPPN